MELLTILYALLAALTGIGGGDRVAVAAPAAISASAVADCASAEPRTVAAASLPSAQRPRAIRRLLSETLAAPVWTPVDPAIVSTIATFANRHE